VLTVLVSEREGAVEEEVACADTAGAVSGLSVAGTSSGTVVKEVVSAVSSSVICSAVAEGVVEGDWSIVSASALMGSRFTVKITAAAKLAIIRLVLLVMPFSVSRMNLLRITCSALLFYIVLC
jgi:hypothetical protein